MKIEITFEESPLIEIEPVTRLIGTAEKRKASAWSWLLG
jgi:hypothetical protein